MWVLPRLRITQALQGGGGEPGEGRIAELATRRARRDRERAPTSALGKAKRVLTAENCGPTVTHRRGRGGSRPPAPSPPPPPTPAPRLGIGSCGRRRNASGR